MRELRQGGLEVFVRLAAWEDEARLDLAPGLCTALLLPAFEELANSDELKLSSHLIEESGSAHQLHPARGGRLRDVGEASELPRSTHTNPRRSQELRRQPSSDQHLRHPLAQVAERVSVVKRGSVRFADSLPTRGDLAAGHSAQHESSVEIEHAPRSFRRFACHELRDGVETAVGQVRDTDDRQSRRVEPRGVASRLEQRRCHQSVQDLDAVLRRGLQLDREQATVDSDLEIGSIAVSAAVCEYVDSDLDEELPKAHFEVGGVGGAFAHRGSVAFGHAASRPEPQLSCPRNISCT
ncbi:MAG: hypothetical protein L6Q99_15660 [Planctomycetes bacterium]|nr:hypothetical protein [Planctomycetota bacterium]